MAFKAFTQAHVYEKKAAPKDKGKSSIHCLECYGRNVYVGSKDATVQHLILPSCPNGDLSPGQSQTKEGRARKLGSNNQVAQLRAVPLFNHLLVLWDRSVIGLNMFSLEPVPGLKKLQHVSLFEVCDSKIEAQTPCVHMVTSSSRSRLIRIHVVGVDRWEVVKEVPLLQDPTTWAVDGSSLCFATCDRYLLCDLQTGSCDELFPHNHNPQGAIVTTVGRGEFLLNGPESLGRCCQCVYGTCCSPGCRAQTAPRVIMCFCSNAAIRLIIIHLPHVTTHPEGVCFLHNIISPSQSLRRVRYGDEDMPAPSPAVASGGAGSRSVLPLRPNPADPSAVCLQRSRPAAQTERGSQRSQGSALHIR